MNERSVRRRHWYSPRSLWRSIVLRPRVYLAAAAGAGVLLALPEAVTTATRASLAWNAGGLVYLAGSFLLMRRCGVDVIRSRAARQDDAGFVILAIILLAIAASFAGIAGLINEAKAASRELKYAYLGLAASTTVVSWLVTQVVFTLHYAHEYYAPFHAGEMAAGLHFPGEEEPDYWDFFYFSTSIGASSQTSDTEIRSRFLRRLVTVHAIVSFFFNTMVLALTINLAASLM